MAELALPERYTDDGIERRNAEISRRQKGAKASGVKIVRDEWDAKLEARLDAADDKIEPWSAPDPIQEAIAKAPKAGFRRRLLSERVCDKRGMRGWEPVKDKNGNLVKVGNQFLGEMPEAKARQRTKFYQDQGNEAIRETQTSFQQQVEKITREAKKLGLEVLQPGETVRGRDTESFLNIRTPSPKPAKSIGLDIRQGA